MAASNGENRRGPQWSHGYRTAAAIRHVTLYSVLHRLSVVVILALHIALVATRVALATGPEAQAHLPSASTFAQA
eukprot:4575786-Pleurochrysis_carterae.AAC.1